MGGDSADGDAALDVGDTGDAADTGDKSEDAADTADTADTGDAADTADASDAADAKDKAPASGAKDAIAAAKKTVAAIKDPATRRVVSDSMAGMIRQMYSMKPSTPKDSYSQILAAKQAKATDAYPTFDDMEARQSAYDNRNPHIKKEEK
jgi:hypothetical protein